MIFRIFKGRDTNTEGRIVLKGEEVGEIRKNFSDITKARKSIGFHRDLDLQQGLEKLLETKKTRNDESPD